MSDLHTMYTTLWIYCPFSFSNIDREGHGSTGKGHTISLQVKHTLPLQLFQVINLSGKGILKKVL